MRNLKRNKSMLITWARPAVLGITVQKLPYSMSILRLPKGMWTLQYSLAHLPCVGGESIARNAGEGFKKPTDPLTWAGVFLMKHQDMIYQYLFY